MLAALRLPGFRWIASVYAFDYLVELAASVVLMVLVYDATDSAVAAAAMLICKQVVPGLLMASLGSFLGRTTIRHGLILSYIVMAASLATLAITGYGPVLFAVAVIAGTAGASVRALLRTAVGRSTTGHDRRTANAFLNVLMGVVALLGPAAGAVLVTASSATTALAITALAAGCMIGCSAALPRTVDSIAIETADEPDGARAPAAPVDRRVSTGGLLILGGLLIGLFAMDEPALLAYAERSLHAGVGGYGAILTAWGLGMIVGSLMHGRLLHHPMLTILLVGATVQAVGYLGLGLAPTIAIACIAAVFGGAGNGVMWVALVTAVQESASVERQAITAARFEGIVTATPAVGMLLGGLVAEIVTPRATLLIPGALALCALLAWSASHRSAVFSPLQRTATRDIPVDATA